MESLGTNLPPKENALTVEEFCFLANTYLEQGLYDKSIQLYETACKLFPENLALKINLGRARSQRHQALETPADIVRSHAEGDQPRRDMYANRFQGLGEIFLKNGRREEARHIFELSRGSNPNFYLPYLNLGRLYLEAGDIIPAIEELEKARRLNPFHEETSDLLRACRLLNREYREALNYAVDAFILSGEASRPTSRGPYRAKIKALMDKLPGVSSEMRNELIRKRRDRINALYEELEQDLAQVGPKPASPEGLTGEKMTDVTSPVATEAMEPEDRQRTHEVAAQLRKHLIFRNMEDEAVTKVARFTSEMTVLKSDYVYQEVDPIYGLYLINRGKVEIQKPTPFGPIVYATFEKGNFFGDDNLLNGRERFSSAVAVKDSDLLFIDKAGLANIFARERPIAIHFLWYFWKSLSFQIREANDRMTSFFAGSSTSTKKELLSATIPQGSRPSSVEIDRKLEVLQVKGLSAKELSHLARLSTEEVYNRSETIFREGDAGDRLYIVLDGSVLISKSITGVGREGLAMLKKGDFFGEMALVGQHTRSADAEAQEQGTTLLVITKEALREILSIDTGSAYQFLTILCRILSQRLLEINEKIYQWRMMSGDFQ